MICLYVKNKLKMGSSVFETRFHKKPQTLGFNSANTRIIH